MGKRILVLAPHTDDGELGCGGTIAKAIQSGDEVFYIAFTGAEKSVPEGFPKDTLRKEVVKATKQLGIREENVSVLNFPVREFNFHRQEILEYLVAVRKELKPDTVYLPSKNDTHQDHEVIVNEGFRAFKNSNVLSYELPWNQIQFSAQCYVELDQSILDRKILALSQYETQKGRIYTSPDFIRSWAIFRGRQCGKVYAEAFEVLRLYM